MRDKNALHDFRTDNVERRQYLRLSLVFPAWWLVKARVDTVVAGIGVEISGGGMQFLLELRHEIKHTECSIAFEINDRRIRANVRILAMEEMLFNGQLFRRYRAKFEGLLESDFDFIISFSKGKTASSAQPERARSIPQSSAERKGSGDRRSTTRTSIGDLRSYDMLPQPTKDRMVKMLVSMKRLAPVRDIKLALMAAHYGGLHPVSEGDVQYHRFSIRTKTDAEQGTVVFDTQFLVSDDGLNVVLRD